MMMFYARLNPGDRVRLKVATIFGNKGPGTVVECYGSDPGSLMRIQLDCNEPGSLTDCCRHEVSRMRKQIGIR